MGQNIVEPERMGPSPLAVSELAKEFKRLAAEAKANIDHWEFQTEHYQAVYRTRYQDFEQAAQMLEERLNGA